MFAPIVKNRHQHDAVARCINGSLLQEPWTDVVDIKRCVIEIQCPRKYTSFEAKAFDIGQTVQPGIIVAIALDQKIAVFIKFEPVL